jgi:hypothetical protein
VLQTHPLVSMQPPTNPLPLFWLREDRIG